MELILNPNLLISSEQLTKYVSSEFEIQ